MLLLLALLLAVPRAGAAQEAPDRIRLNQLGFLPAGPKAAVVVEAPAGPFFITTPDGADTLLAGTLGPARVWDPSGEAVRLADFSGVRAAGRYVVAVPGVGVSAPFAVRLDVYDALARAALKAFFYQRASAALPPAYAGPWHRPAGHPDTDVRVHPAAATDARPAGTRLAAPGGWYDAGDYNKYVVNAGITTATLLALYEHVPAYFDTLALGLPEGHNGLPDLLDEVLFNLRWMLAMQDPHDGGVYHKLTTPDFEGAVMPREARQTRYVVQKSTAATLDFAAVTAQAARLFTAFEAELPGLADTCRAAAQQAWRWARRHPDVYYDQRAMNARFDPDVETGTYGDRDVSDEFRWAAAELYVTTRQDSFLAHHDLFAEEADVPGWPNVGTLGLLTLAHHRATLTPAVDTTRVTEQLLGLARRLVAGRAASAYGVVMGQSARDFVWGSNAVAANQGVVLLQAYRLTGDTAYRDAALANLDYLLGRNATGYSFVTGYGHRTPRHPHHRLSQADDVDDPVPGLLVGGPNPGQQDRCAGYPSRLPARSYLDDYCSYAANEIAINWNAPLAYLAGAVAAMRQE